MTKATDLDAARAARLQEKAAGRASDAALDAPVVAEMQALMAQAAQNISDAKSLAAKLIHPLTSDDVPLMPHLNNLAVSVVNVKNVLTTLAADTANAGKE